ncbi:MAG: hypothetical protein A2785_02590 [Candidatus Chisholmbacteria bacterium RIFCSPHIGHO2_01_FULL_49_18]|uniref:Methyltransferase n=1 Tax=Candidatus Chisholmbacteria bacterium RIFCSPHIGHO2_01_FULL_49_18 TaxID=1797590 RepID=A0A1G1VKU6_9BACT|nr:MAG: hypothetical protein A2785_02590 [Candidatus Chisholmbacteria bacterium RIFCSPHIGHO2_01_FULL_49_18]
MMKKIQVTVEQILKQIEDRPDAFPITAEPETGQMLAAIIQLIDASEVLEIGTNYVYTMICMARALEPTGSVSTIDIEDKAIPYFKQLPKKLKR